MVTVILPLAFWLDDQLPQPHEQQLNPCPIPAKPAAKMEIPAPKYAKPLAKNSVCVIIWKKCIHVICLL